MYLWIRCCLTAVVTCRPVALTRHFKVLWTTDTDTVPADWDQHQFKVHSLNVKLETGFPHQLPPECGLGKHASSTLTLSTGVPLGCVLSPLLYALLTHDCHPIHNNNLVLNTKKTKIIMDFQTSKKSTHSPAHNSAEVVERVPSFWFLEVRITEDLSWAVMGKSITTPSLSEESQPTPKSCCQLLQMHRREHLNKLPEAAAAPRPPKQPSGVLWKQRRTLLALSCRHWNIFTALAVWGGLTTSWRTLHTICLSSSHQSTRTQMDWKTAFSQKLWHCWTHEVLPSFQRVQSLLTCHFKPLIMCNFTSLYLYFAFTFFVDI